MNAEAVQHLTAAGCIAVGALVFTTARRADCCTHTSLMKLTKLVLSDPDWVATATDEGMGSKLSRRMAT
jgi:hypothetical protein